MEAAFYLPGQRCRRRASAEYFACAYLSAKADDQLSAGECELPTRNGLSSTLEADDQYLGYAINASPLQDPEHPLISAENPCFAFHFISLAFHAKLIGRLKVIWTPVCYSPAL
jgi:hypothetical protein